jgi:hypothetical protein
MSSSTSFGISKGLHIHQVRPCDACSTYANRLHYSRYYTWAYGVMILITLILIIWTIATHGGPKSGTPLRGLYVFVDVFVNMMLVTEVMVRVIAFGKQFWRSWWNIFDMVLTVVCVILPFLILDASTSDQVAVSLYIYYYHSPLKVNVFYFRVSKR